MVSDEAEAIRTALNRATQQLLGDTIAVEDVQWHQPSRLPDWSRAQLATHLARNADALGRLLDGVVHGREVQMYDSEDQRDAEIAAGTDRTGLELQTDLDTSAERLGELLEKVIGNEEWAATTVQLRNGQRCAARDLARARLCEVVLHHVDLDIGYSLPQVEPAIAQLVLGWAIERMQTKPEMPAVVLDFEGGTAQIGEAATLEVSGTLQAVLGWLTGREGGPVEGAEGIEPPPL